MQLENISDRNGRALEYKIIDYLISGQSKFKVVLSQQAKSDQLRDISKYESLPIELKSNYSKTAVMIHNWLLNLISCKEIFVDKNTDESGKKGDVTDISIVFGDKTINLSVKHNHSALKHQRPPTTAIWCGYNKKSKEDLEFRKAYNDIVDRFLFDSKVAMPLARNFRDLVTITGDYIKDNLYYPVCKVITEAINKLCVDRSHAQYLFNFLVGSTGFYKVIDLVDKVLILDFTKMPKAESVQAALEGKSYIYLTFSNGWKLSMRLHTAASKLGKSLKFDTQAIELPDLEKQVLEK
ncbi:MAG: HaeIII family restriction endonuclease [Candidatus Omnitrophica bacterium]|nr:HaeIII family restriction endonuclease [Candidatus Omnitrophota bacterium]MDD5592791.1 HaeIII family restriction endonuclease [Candidatus Omnitrophota bacterium]